MMRRILCLCAGVAAGAAGSQYPAFSDAYLQRLAGQVDALSEVVKDFDTSALDAGLGREAALQQMTGTKFLAARQADMRATFLRHAKLTDDLTALRGATPFARMVMPHRHGDADTLRATLNDFQPALPLSSAGAAAAGGGFVVGWMALAAIIALLFRLVRPRSTARLTRQEPTLARPQPRLVSDNTPRLGGAQR